MNWVVALIIGFLIGVLVQYISNRVDTREMTYTIQYLNDKKSKPNVSPLVLGHIHEISSNKDGITVSGRLNDDGYSWYKNNVFNSIEITLKESDDV
jgi:hypothetical protein